jgi:Flp pilus assembly protein TadG
MRLISGRINPKRPRARGVAAIEFALILPFIAVIVLALIDYGYYFYIGVNATEAARTAAVQASATAQSLNGNTGPIAPPNGCSDLAIGLVTGVSPAAPAKAAKDYMTAQVNSTIGGNTTATVGCSTAGTGLSMKTVFSVQVQVVFAPPSGTVHFGLPRSGNNLVYTTKTLWRWYP